MPIQEASLVTELRKRGIQFLTVPSHTDENPISDQDLVKLLVKTENSSIRLALIPLVLHSESIATDFHSVVQSLSVADKTIAKLLYTAAAALQRRWWTTLNIYTKQILLDDLYSKELSISPVSENFGRNAIEDISERLRATYKMPYNYEADFDKQIQLYIELLK